MFDITGQADLAIHRAGEIRLLLGREFGESLGRCLLADGQRLFSEFGLTASDVVQTLVEVFIATPLGQFRRQLRQVVEGTELSRMGLVQCCRGLFSRSRLVFRVLDDALPSGIKFREDSW